MAGAIGVGYYKFIP